MTATDLRPVPVTRLRPLPDLSRDRREVELTRLLEDHLFGVPPSAAAMAILLAGLAAASLTAAEAGAKWEDVLSEARRVQAVEAGEPDWRDVDPRTCREDYAAALNDLIDGTNTLTGARP